MEMDPLTRPEDPRVTLENEQKTTQSSMNDEDPRNTLENARETTQRGEDEDNPTLLINGNRNECETTSISELRAPNKFSIHCINFRKCVNINLKWILKPPDLLDSY
ncbi:hypothetical protein JTB14_019552 [Gonioctena quinquepunctata]|nr:hypothetical protein JTB14_019552 [Gonioctena quinquepunctata]